MGVYVPIWLVLPRCEATSLGVFDPCHSDLLKQGCANSGGFGARLSELLHVRTAKIFIPKQFKCAIVIVIPDGSDGVPADGVFAKVGFARKGDWGADAGPSRPDLLQTLPWARTCFGQILTSSGSRFLEMVCRSGSDCQCRHVPEHLPSMSFGVSFGLRGNNPTLQGNQTKSMLCLFCNRTFRGKNSLPSKRKI